MAKVLSSISGNLISAASAGYAPTNSGDVSAIASGYQVVSATGTQLYGGTAHVTSINSAPISASRAGNAANASMANSAYYDGTGRLISALPDSAAVSSIASSYAPTFGLNGGKISSINGSALDTPTGGGVVTATGSGWGDGVICVSSINGSSILAQSATRAANDSFGNSIAGYYAAYSSVTGVSSTVHDNSASWGSVTSPSGTIIVTDGNKIEGTNSAASTSGEPGFSTQIALDGTAIAYAGFTRLYNGALPDTGATLLISSQSNIWNAQYIFSGATIGGALVSASASASNGASLVSANLGGIVSAISASSNFWTTITGSATAEKAGTLGVTGVAELAWKSAVDDVTNTVSSNSASWGGGGIDSATCSAIASSYAESAVSSKADSSALSSYALSADVSAYRVVSSITTAPDDMAMDGEVVTTINGTELRALNATMDLSGRYLTNLPDSAAVSAIASSYAESAVSSKADSSALSSYALSADVSGTVDLVSTQSANWGGSALALSAGPGVKLELSGNTLVASTDETVLWSGAGSTTGSTINLSESLGNFERYGIYYYIPYGECGPQYIEKRYSAGQTAFNMSTIQVANALVRCYCDWGSMNSTSISLVSGRQAGVWYTGASVDWYDGSDRHHTITKVVGINRTAGV